MIKKNLLLRWGARPLLPPLFTPLAGIRCGASGDDRALERVIGELRAKNGHLYQYIHLIYWYMIGMIIGSWMQQITHLILLDRPWWLPGAAPTQITWSCRAGLSRHLLAACQSQQDQPAHCHCWHTHESRIYDIVCQCAYSSDDTLGSCLTPFSADLLPASEELEHLHFTTSMVCNEPAEADTFDKRLLMLQYIFSYTRGQTGLPPFASEMSRSLNSSQGRTQYLKYFSIPR